MPYPDLTSATVLADTISAAGDRITTIQATFPRFILAEFNTHRQLSRNSASSRAIPVEKQIANMLDHPFVPQRFPINKPGMSAVEYFEPERDPEYRLAEGAWLHARDRAVTAARHLLSLKVHKAIANRLLEPFMWHTVIATATWEPSDWPNFFGLRISPEAMPEIDKVARLIKQVCDESTPRVATRRPGRDCWHLPLIDPDDPRPLRELITSSVARIAAVSYNRHEVVDIAAETRRYELLARNKHLSPFEHVAHPWGGRNANFTGWRQVRWYVERNLDAVTMDGLFTEIEIDTAAGC